MDLDGFKDGWKLIRKVRASSEFGSPKVLLVSQKGLSDQETDLAVRLGVNACVDEVKELAADVRRMVGT